MYMYTGKIFVGLGSQKTIFGLCPVFGVKLDTPVMTGVWEKDNNGL